MNWKKGLTKEQIELVEIANKILDEYKVIVKGE